MVANIMMLKQINGTTSILQLSNWFSKEANPAHACLMKAFVLFSGVTTEKKVPWIRLSDSIWLKRKLHLWHWEFLSQ